METILQRLKPSASRRQHLFLAGLLWTVVGGGLLFFGSRWTLAALAPGAALALLAAGVAAGVVKARFALDPAARKIVARIVERGDGRCIGGFLSLRSWALVAAMVLLGRVLRGGLVPLAVVGVLYAAIGTGLIVSSRLAWSAWKAG